MPIVEGGGAAFSNNTPSSILMPRGRNKKDGYPNTFAHVKCAALISISNQVAFFRNIFDSRGFGGSFPNNMIFGKAETKNTNEIQILNINEIAAPFPSSN
jgi:hypothetical protein